jgi:hypothetical protein
MKLSAEMPRHAKIAGGAGRIGLPPHVAAWEEDRPGHPPQEFNAGR